MKPVILFLPFCLFCCTPLFEEANLKEYVCKAGTHDFTPNPPIIPRRVYTFRGQAAFDKSCWYNTLGTDNQDWNKLIGAYNFFDVFKDVNGAEIAWRPDTTRFGWFEVCFYENVAKQRLPGKKIITVYADQQFSFEFLNSNGRYQVKVNGEIMGTSQVKFSIVGPVSAWFGGNRKSPHDMKLYLSTS